MKKTLQYLLYALFLIVTLAFSVMLARSWASLNEMKIKVSELEQALQEKNTKCLELHQEIYDLKHNPRAVEKIARERCKLVGDHERIYTYPKEKKKQKEL